MNALTGSEAVAAYARRWPACVVSDTMYTNNAGKLAQANEWVDAAEPLLEAYATLSTLHEGAYAFDGMSGSELRRIYADAMSNVRDEIDQVRDAVLADYHCGLQDDDAAQECADEFNEWLTDNVTSVREALVARMNMEGGRG